MARPNQPVLRYKIEGMDCAEEVSILRRGIGPMVGGEDRLAFDVLSGVVSVAGLAPEDQGRLIEAIGRTGMRARPIEPAQVPHESTWWARRGRLALTAASGILTAAAFAVHASVAGSRRMLAIFRANILLSLAGKALFVGLTLAGHASLWAASAADVGMSLLVITNAPRLLRKEGLQA
jgi:hypothetical protein